MTGNDTERRSSKSGLRRRVLRCRRELDRARHAALSATIQRHFLRSSLFFAGDALGCYIATRDEVDTSLIIERAWRAGKRLYVPVTHSRGNMQFVRIERSSRLVRSRLGIWEPVDGALIPARDLDVVVTPLAAYDQERNRIGMGGGYFDRQFAFLNRRHSWMHPKLVGLAFSCQRVETIATDAWDVSLYRIVDEHGVN